MAPMAVVTMPTMIPSMKMATNRIQKPAFSAVATLLGSAEEPAACMNYPPYGVLTTIVPASLSCHPCLLASKHRKEGNSCRQLVRSEEHTSELQSQSNLV